MVRDLARLAHDPFDVVIVGGGVYGLATAWDLTSRGLRVALLERGDFAAATSFNSLKTVHGGIRALQHGAFGEMREFVRERRAFAHMAPHLVRTLPFVVPTYRHPVRNRAAMALFFAAYDRFASDRNRGVDASRRLPRSRTIGRAECLRLNPAIDPAGVTGGAIWHDYQLHSPERFAMALLHSAARDGACAANYVDVPRILTGDSRVRGVQAIDRLTGDTFDVRGSIVVNAAGPGAWALLTRSGLGPSVPPPRFSLAMNLVLDRPPLASAVGGLVNGRYLFMVPWRDRSIVGTSHDDPGTGPTPAGAPPDRVTAPPDLVAAFMREAAEAFPQAGIAPDRVTLVHRGLLPAGHGHGSLLKRSIVLDHGPERLHGLVTVVGVRYTTARATAQLAGDRVIALLGRRPVPSLTATRALHGGDIPNVAEYVRQQRAGARLRPETTDRLVATYGTAWNAIAGLIAADPTLGRALSSTCPVTGAEIVHAARDEMAVHLCDALLRRTNAGAGGQPDAEAVNAAASIMAAEHHWSHERMAEEIEAVARFY